MSRLKSLFKAALLGKQALAFVEFLMYNVHVKDFIQRPRIEALGMVKT